MYFPIEHSPLEVVIVDDFILMIRLACREIVVEWGHS